METVKARARRALLLLALREGQERVTQLELASRLTKRLKLKEPLGQSTVGKWLDGTLPSDVDTMIGFARELGADPGWLYFGEASAAPPPLGADFGQTTKKTRGSIANPAAEDTAKERGQA